MNTPAESEPTARSEQAAEWCRCVAEGNLSPEQARAFEQWIGADEKNRRAFDRATFIWRALDGKAAPPQLVEVRLDALSALRSGAASRGSGRLSRWKWPIATAAAIVAIALAATLYLAVRTVTYETAIGERRVVVLKDGSRVSLDGASRIDVGYSQNRRRLDLRTGRAKFDVAPDPLRPFSVAVTDKVVVATGTSFSVEMLTRQVEVVLYEGHVSVLHKQAATTPKQSDASASLALERALQPGQAALFPQGAPPIVRTVDVLHTLLWESGQISCADEPLDLAVERMNRYSSVPLKVEERASNVLISGVFNANDTEAFVEGITSVFPVSAHRQGDAIVLSNAQQ